MTELDAEPFAGVRLSHWKIEFDPAAARPGAGCQHSGLWEVSNGGWPEVRRHGDTIHMIFAGSCRFVIDSEKHHISVCDLVETVVENDIMHLLNDHVAPRLLAEAGALVLHGSAVDFGGAIALFLGETGAGKSTLAASLDKSGCRLLGDDAVIVVRSDEGDFLGEPVYPSLRLFPESIDALVKEGTPTAPMSGYSEKRVVKLAELEERSGEQMPIAALFFLDGDTGATSSQVARLGPTMACIALVEQSFSMDPADSLCAARRLADCAALSQAVPAFKLSYPRDFNRLPEVHEVIKAALATHL